MPFDGEVLTTQTTSEVTKELSSPPCPYFELKSQLIITSFMAIVARLGKVWAYGSSIFHITGSLVGLNDFSPWRCPIFTL